jgi:ribosomal protein S3AE
MWQYGVDQWIGWNEFIYGKTKEERLEKITKEVDAQYAKCTIRIATKSGMNIATYFKRLAGNDWLKLLLKNSNGCNV